MLSHSHIALNTIVSKLKRLVELLLIGHAHEKFGTAHVDRLRNFRQQWDGSMNGNVINWNAG